MKIVKLPIKLILHGALLLVDAIRRRKKKKEGLHDLEAEWENAVEIMREMREKGEG